MIELSISISLCTVYIPPNPSNLYINSLLTYLADFISSSEHVIIVGDFNLPDINWNTLAGTSPFSIYLCDPKFDYNLVQVEDFPTHIKENIMDTIISNTSFINDVLIEPSHLISSDHFMVLSTVACDSKPVDQHKAKYIFDFKNADMESPHLLDYDFSNCFALMTYNMCRL